MKKHKISSEREFLLTSANKMRSKKNCEFFFFLYRLYTSSKAKKEANEFVTVDLRDFHRTYFDIIAWYDKQRYKCPMNR